VKYSIIILAKYLLKTRLIQHQGAFKTLELMLETFTCTADVQQVPPIRSAVEKQLLHMGIEKKTIYHVVSTVDELCNNAIEHGSSSTSKILLSINTTEEQIQIACEDDGGGTTVSPEVLQEQMESPNDPNSIRGRGLLLVKSFSNRLTIGPSTLGGIKITATILLHS
jgi:anti-sigma regulatory factor (Ser/Thr protein kinase)